MTDYKLVPIDPAPEMVEAAEDAYMPFGDMEMAIRMALLAAPAVQREPVGVASALRAFNGFTTAVFDSSKVPEGTKLYAAPQPAEQQPEILAKGYFHPLPHENDYEFHDAENFPNGSDCPVCVPAVIVRNGVEEIQPALRTLIGRTVSMDVSTGEHDAFHRLFGTVVGVEGQDGIILCELDDDNEDKQPVPDVAGLVEALDRIANLPLNPCSTENDYRLSAAKAIALAAVSDFRDAALAAHRKGGEA